MEGYVNLFVQENVSGTNRPHYKGYLKIDGVDHEFALWPNKDGKQGFSGKYKPVTPKESNANVTQADADKVWADAQKAMTPKPVARAAPAPPVDDSQEIPF